MTMSTILALLMSLALAMTGGAPGARSMTYSDMSVELGGEMYELDPSVTLTVASGEDQALLDFFVDLNGEKLFPVQLKADASGLTGIFGSDDRGFKLDAAMIDEAFASLNDAMGEESQQVLAALQLYTAAVEAFSDPETMAATVAGAWNDRAAQKMAAEDVTVTVDGTEKPASHIVITMDAADLGAVLDSVMAAYPGIGSQVAEFTGGVPFEAILGENADALTVILDATLDENGAGDGTLTFRVNDSGDIFETSALLTFLEGGSVNVSWQMDSGAGPLELEAGFTPEGMHLEMSLDGGDDDRLDLTMDAQTIGEDSATFWMAESLVSDEVEMNLTETALKTGDCMDANVALVFRFPDPVGDIGLRYTIRTEPTELEDRVAGAEVTVISGAEDDTALAAAAMTVIGNLSLDAGKLMSDPGVAALVKAAGEFTESLTGSFAGTEPAVEPDFDGIGDDGDDGELTESGLDDIGSEGGDAALDELSGLIDPAELENTVNDAA